MARAAAAELARTQTGERRDRVAHERVPPNLEVSDRADPIVSDRSKKETKGLPLSMIFGSAGHDPFEHFASVSSFWQIAIQLAIYIIAIPTIWFSWVAIGAGFMAGWIPIGIIAFLAVRMLAKIYF